jgi:hypothetical protein
MWKALVGFLVFAAIALFFIFKAGDKMDMQGEAGAHTGAASEQVSAPPASAVASTPAPVVDAASAASTASVPTTPVVEASPAAASASASK